MNFNVKLEEDIYEAVLLDMTDEKALVEVDGELFEVQLANPYHDSLGRFASKIGGYAPRVNNAAISSAAMGAGIGAVVGAVKGVFTKDEMGRKVGLRRGAFQGAVYGAKKGLIAGAVKEVFNIGAESAGDYGFAIKLIGGLSVAFAGAKGLSALGVTNLDIRGIGASVASAGLFDLIMQFEEIQLEDYSKIASIALALAEALEEQPEADYIGFDKSVDLTPLGFEEKDEAYIISQERAIDLLAALVTFAEVKLEIEENEVIKLFNPYHDTLGRFSSAGQAYGVAKVVTGAAFVGGIGAAIGGSAIRGFVGVQAQRKYGKGGILSGTAQEVESNRNKILKEKVFKGKIAGKDINITYGQLDRFGEKAAKIGVRSAAAGYILGTGLEVAATFYAMRNDYEPGQNRSSNNRRRRQEEWKSWNQKQQQWPKNATEDDFKSMYRKLAKKWHPDVNQNSRESTDVMKKINDMYNNKNWKGIEDLYKQLQMFIESIISLEEPKIPEDQFEMLGILMRIIEEALKDGSNFIVFPSEGDEKNEDFIYEDDEMILDKQTAQMALDVFNSLMDSEKLEIDFNQYITEL